MQQCVGAFRAAAAFPAIGAALPGLIPGVGSSDHWSFARVGYPALMITDTAPFRYRYYHTPQDTPDKMDFERMEGWLRGWRRWLRAWDRSVPNDVHPEPEAIRRLRPALDKRLSW